MGRSYRSYLASSSARNAATIPSGFPASRRRKATIEFCIGGASLTLTPHRGPPQTPRGPPPPRGRGPASPRSPPFFAPALQPSPLRPPPPPHPGRDRRPATPPPR